MKNVRVIAGKGKDSLPWCGEGAAARAFLRRRWHQKETLDAASAFTYLPDGCAPLYIQHGDKDPAVPFAQSKRLFEAAQKVLAEEDLVFDVLEGAAHAGAGIDYFKKENVVPILNFFKRHLWERA